jgi:hypothetical protein
LGKGSLFATGLVAGGALAGVLVAMGQAWDLTAAPLEGLSLMPAMIATMGVGGYDLLGLTVFLILAAGLVKAARSK